ncbi:MAG TPA: catalase family peroxidase [Candidatus Acidoferrum sp.]|nr:catalase family peroxidase [Candidatus Acidoferrum sp.]
MPSDATAPTEKTPIPLTGGDKLARFAGVGIILLGVVGAFLCLGGWFSPNKLTPGKFVDGFQQVDGVYSGFRRNHAKGVCVTGFFDSNGNGVQFSKALVFRAGRVPVIGRFSLGGGDPYMADSAGAVRGFGIEYKLPDGEEWRTAMVDLPVFPFHTPQDFYDNLMASKPDPATHQPDPAKMAAFVASHPEFLAAIKILKSGQPSSGFDNSAYYSLNAFLFKNESGKVTPVRWWLQPVQPYVAANAAGAPAGDKNYLFDGLIASILQHPLQWHLMLIIGQPGDPTDNATIMWPESRQQVDAGTLTIDTVESEETSPTRDVNFDPLVLPDGISPSDDPLLSARSAIYSQSFTRRAGEKKEASAITPADVRK